MILLLILVASLSYCNSAGVQGSSNRNLGHRTGHGYSVHRPRLPVRRPGLPVRRPGLSPFRPGGSGMPMTTTTAPPASRPISEEDDYLAAEIGVRLPPNECVISKDQFTEHVVGMDWIGPYVIDNDFPLNPGISYKINLRWAEVNSTFIRRRGSLWDDITGMCVYLDAEFKRIGGDKAIFGASGGGDNFAVSGRVDYMVSFDPSRYLIFYICYDKNKSYKGRCPNSEIFLLFKDQRDTPIGSDGVRRGDIVLNDIHWRLVEETFKHCLGQQFVDHTEPQIKWVWENDDCPKPGTSQFTEGVNG